MNDLYEIDIQELLSEASKQAFLAEQNAELFSEDPSKISEAGNRAYKQHILQFIKQIQTYLPQITTESISILIFMLINLNIDSEDEEEIINCLNILSSQANLRISNYLNTRNLTSTTQQSSSIDFLLKIFPYNEIEAVENMLKTLHEKSLYLDVIAKNPQISQKIKKEITIQHQQIATISQDIINIKKQQHLLSQKTQKQLQEQQKRDQIRLKNKQLINQEFQNRRNRKIATKISEKNNQELTKQDIKKIKIKIISNKKSR